MKRFCSVLLVSLLLYTLFFLPVCADSEEELEKAIPEELQELFLGENGISLPELPYFLRFSLAQIKESLKENRIELRLLLGLSLLCSIFTLLQKCLRREDKGVLHLCVLLSGCFCIVGGLSGLFLLTGTHLTKLSAFLSAMLPVVTGASLSMGGVGQAAVGGTAFTMIFSLIGNFTSGILLPLLQVGTVFDLCAVVTGNKGLSSFGSTLRKAFLSLLGLVTTLILTVFAFQQVLAAKQDSLSLRAFRYTAGNMIPLVGSAFSESSKTLLSGLSLIRATVGGTGAAVVLLMLLPVLVQLLLARLIFQLSRSFSEALDNTLLTSLFSCGISAAGGLCALVALSDLGVLVAFAVTMYTSL